MARRQVILGSILFLALVLVCATAARTARPAQAEEVGVSPNVRVFTGSEGLEVTIVRLMPLARKQALVKVAGIDSEWNNRIFLCSLDESTGRADYVFSLEGKRYVLVAARGQSGSLSYGVYLKDIPEERAILYSAARSRQVKSRAILAEYQKQGRK